MDQATSGLIAFICAFTGLCIIIGAVRYTIRDRARERAAVIDATLEANGMIRLVYESDASAMDRIVRYAQEKEAERFRRATAQVPVLLEEDEPTWPGNTCPHVSTTPVESKWHGHGIELRTCDACKTTLAVRSHERAPLPEVG